MKKTRKKSKRRFSSAIKIIITVPLIIGAVLGISVAAVNIGILIKANDRILSFEEACELENADCVIVLGCQVKKGVPSPMLQDRIDCGIRLYKTGISEVIVASGDGQSKRYDEVGTMKKVFMENGISEDDIVGDGYGLSTYDSIYRTAKLYGYKKIVIVTQKYHLYRAVYIAEKLGIEAYGVAADTRSYSGQYKREIREIAARTKDFIFCLADADAQMGVDTWNWLQ